MDRELVTREAFGEVKFLRLSIYYIDVLSL